MRARNASVEYLRASVDRTREDDANDVREASHDGREQGVDEPSSDARVRDIDGVLRELSLTSFTLKKRYRVFDLIVF